MKYKYVVTFAGHELTFWNGEDLTFWIQLGRMLRPEGFSFSVVTKPVTPKILLRPGP